MKKFISRTYIFLVFFFAMIHVLARPRDERTRKDRT